MKTPEDVDPLPDVELRTVDVLSDVCELRTVDVRPVCELVTQSIGKSLNSAGREPSVKTPEDVDPLPDVCELRTVL